jgi:16S rRNA (guanine966-N2)-methyltransferase
MTERVREAVFASLGSLDLLDGARVLDLFAGTGAIGIEALSRGAKEAVFVEADHAAAATVLANLAATGFSGVGRIVREDVLRYLERTPAGTEPFDLAFADPPYRFTDWHRLLRSLPATTAVFESTKEITAVEGWESTDTRRYGGSVVTFLRRSPSQDSPAPE